MDNKYSSLKEKMCRKKTHFQCFFVVVISDQNLVQVNSTMVHPDSPQK